MKPAFRKPLLAVHTWVGLPAGIVLLIVALTGAALLFRSKFERRWDAARFIVEPGTKRVSIDELTARARAAHPAGELESVRFYGDPTASLLVLFSNKEYVHMNPWTGAVLGTRQRYGEGFGWVEGLHKYLTLEPEIGENVNGSFAIVFAGFTLTGVVLWWPATRRALKAGLTLNWKLKGRPWNLSLHKTLGSYAALVILFSALTGIPIAWDSTRAVFDFFSGAAKSPPPAALAPVAAGPLAGFDAAARQLEALMPGATETYIARPKNGVVVSYAIAANAPHPNARSYLWLDGRTAGVIRFTPYAQATPGFRFYYWLLSLHTGVAGGVGWQIILLFGTLSVPLLGYTGLASYLRRAKRRPAPESVPVTGRSAEPANAFAK
jgi:uncharacterized iron-regulated membrane protein